MTIDGAESAVAVDVHQRMTELLFGCWASQTLKAMVDLSVADHLAAGGLTATEVAAREHSDPDSTYRLLRGGVAFGLLTADEDGRFHGTPLLDTIRTDAPRSLRDLVLTITSDSHWLSWREFAASVRTGHSQAPTALGTDLFTYLERNPNEAREFSAGMAAITSLWASDLARLIDTNNVQRAVDVGGANGSMLRLLQEANASLRGVVFDRPDVAGDVAAAVAQSEFADRTEVVGGDFFIAVPAGDLHLLKFVLHDWDDDSCIQILRRCRDAMAPGGRIAIIELLVEDINDPGVAALMDLNMLVVSPSGRERSLPEFDALLAAAGLRRTSMVRTANSPQGVIEAMAA